MVFYLMKALITGITGQDGSYLAEELLSEEHEVHGIIRRSSVPEHQTKRIDHIKSDLFLHDGDLTDALSIDRIVSTVVPDEIFHLAAQSHVGKSFNIPQYTAEVNAIGTLYILESMKQHCPDSKMYHAATSEMFGNSIDDDGFQRETTPMHPTSPYGCAKLYAHNMCAHYRKAHNLFICSGILFNHESPRRGENFVTSKVTKAAVEIKLGLRDKIELGSLDAKRDWGHAKDYIKAIRLMMSQNKPLDCVVATGESRTVKDLVSFVFEYLGMDYMEHVILSQKLMRPEEIWELKGDSTKIRSLGWKPDYSFEDMMIEMVNHWQDQ